MALAALLQNLYGRTLRARIWRGLAEEGTLARTRISYRSIYGLVPPPAGDPGVRPFGRRAGRGTRSIISIEAVNRGR